MFKFFVGDEVINVNSQARHFNQTCIVTMVKERGNWIAARYSDGEETGMYPSSYKLVRRPAGPCLMEEER